MDSQTFIEGMSHAASTVSVITTDGPHGRAGVTVSAMASVSAEPPTLLACVHHLSPACEKLRKNGVMAVNVLGEDQSGISDTFAGRRKIQGEDKFRCARWNSGSTGAPLLDDALINFDCRIIQQFTVGTHIVFIAAPVTIHFREYGRALIYANRAYGTARNLDQFVGAGHPPASDTLRIGCFATIGPFFIPQLVSRFLDRHPATRFEFFEGTEVSLQEGIDQNRFDLVMMYDSPAIHDPDKVELARTAPHVLLPAQHVLAGQSSISLKELADQPMVLLDISPSRDYFTSLFQEQGLEPDIAYRSPSFETVRGMVANGLGFSILISKPANAMSYDGRALVSRPITESVTHGCVILRRFPDNSASPELVHRFARHCKSFFAGWGI